jgi:hypothetical protein
MVERFAPNKTNTAGEEPGQGFATPAAAALNPIPCLPEDLSYRSEALFRIAHGKSSLLTFGVRYRREKQASQGLDRRKLYLSLDPKTGARQLMGD